MYSFNGKTYLQKDKKKCQFKNLAIIMPVNSDNISSQYVSQFSQENNNTPNVFVQK